MGRCQECDLVDPVEQAGGNCAVPCLYVQGSKQLLDHQTAEAVADQDDAAVLQLRLGEEAPKDVLGTIDKMHRGALQPRDGRFVSDRPDGKTVDVLGKPPGP